MDDDVAAVEEQDHEPAEPGRHGPTFREQGTDQRPFLVRRTTPEHGNRNQGQAVVGVKELGFEAQQPWGQRSHGIATPQPRRSVQKKETPLLVQAFQRRHRRLPAAPRRHDVEQRDVGQRSRCQRVDDLLVRGPVATDQGRSCPDTEEATRQGVVVTVSRMLARQTHGSDDGQPETADFTRLAWNIRLRAQRPSAFGPWKVGAAGPQATARRKRRAPVPSGCEVPDRVWGAIG